MKQVNIYITLWSLFFLISPAAVSFENHHNGKHQTISTINCPQKSDTEGRNYLSMAMHTKEKFNELRSTVAVFSNLNNEQIMMAMKSMGPNYYWTVDQKDPDQKTGALILAHGYGKEGDRSFRNSMDALSSKYITSLSLGMSMMTSKHIECALLDMKNKGAENIYVVPISSTSHNSLVQQWEYIFGLRNDHAYTKVKSFQLDNVVFLNAIDDHPIAKQIVFDHVQEISTDPGNEVVVIIAHGPVSKINNDFELELLENIAIYIRENGKFNDVRAFTIQDDAPKEIRSTNINQIKTFMQAASLNGNNVLMVSNLMSGKGIQKKIYDDFSGLDYKFNSKGFLNHPQFKEWIIQSIESNHK